MKVAIIGSGISGLTAAYRESQRDELLVGARRVANWWVSHLPPDMVPYWDFTAEHIPHLERDASAAAIAASGLYELSGYVGGVEKERYRRAADGMLAALCRDFLSTGTAAESILLHSVGSKPLHSEVDVGVIYADYYLLEAIRRRGALKTGSS